jgi:hypothetical protein
MSHRIPGRCHTRLAQAPLRADKPIGGRLTNRKDMIVWKRHVDDHAPRQGRLSESAVLQGQSIFKISI